MAFSASAHTLYRAYIPCSFGIFVIRVCMYVWIRNIQTCGSLSLKDLGPFIIYEAHPSTLPLRLRNDSGGGIRDVVHTEYKNLHMYDKALLKIFCNCFI